MIVVIIIIIIITKVIIVITVATNDITSITWDMIPNRLSNRLYWDLLLLLEGRQVIRVQVLSQRGINKLCDRFASCCCCCIASYVVGGGD